jgi:transcriptional regulator with XRE-family HTH domain
MTTEGKRELRLFGESIRRERKLLGVSQEGFAELCDVHRTYIGQVERGEKNISLINILRIAKALRKKPSSLLELAEL